MRKADRRNGMAIVIVVTLAAAILMMGISYIRTVHNQGGRNTIELGAIQADLLAEGITQIAMLKFKEIPGPFYYAYIAHVKGTTSEPYKNYHSDEIINGSIAAPCNAEFRTTFQLLPSKMYEDMNIKISVQVKVFRVDGVEFNRNIERTIAGARRPAY
ncbi:MAG: hypothetical protein ACD_39C01862G0003 [uncultured bacterium]|nr:MAG: hypothetical protein ACD_39C01862G0003 [uncultured bacterium]OGK06146.1 MAG: hypothetical protein A2W80_15420 [Candidatus Riflebacteria bacterium GWC2_50_8]